MAFPGSNVQRLCEDYTTVLCGDDVVRRDSELSRCLIKDCDWTPEGAATIIGLAKAYGSSILRNALALAIVLDIEDGEVGL